jgi:hypothetical protein
MSFAEGSVGTVVESAALRDMGTELASAIEMLRETGASAYAEMGECAIKAAPVPHF